MDASNAECRIFRLCEPRYLSNVNPALHAVTRQIVCRPALTAVQRQVMARAEPRMLGAAVASAEQYAYPL